MPRHEGLELAIGRAEVLLAPQVADSLFAVQTEVGPLGGDGGRVVAAVEQADGFGAVFEVFGPNFQWALMSDASRPDGRAGPG